MPDGLTITIDDEQVRRLLERIAERGTDLKPALSAVGSLIKESIRTNFAQGGRPTPWKPVKNRDGQPLRDTGRLMNSITRKVTGNEVKVGSNVVYAALHHYGAEKGSFGTFVHMVKSHKRRVTQAFGKPLKFPVWATVHPHAREVSLPIGNIPARPFMLVQDEDMVDIKDILTHYITEGEL